MLRKLCEYKGVEIIEAEACKDHIHMLISIPPKYSVAQIMGYLKGKSSLMIYEKYANLKYKYGNRHFWCRGYYVSTVGRNRRAVEQYIRNQLQEDIAADQMSITEYVDPFTGKPVNGAREICAIGRPFDEPIGSARNMPQGGLCKPPARPVVMIWCARRESNPHALASTGT